MSVTSFLAPTTETVLTFTLVVTDSLGLRCTEPDQVVVFVRAEVFSIYLPLVLRSAP